MSTFTAWCLVILAATAMVRAHFAEKRVRLAEDRLDLLTERVAMGERIDAAVLPVIRGVCDGIAARAAKPPPCTGPLGSCTVAGGRCVHCGRAAKEARPS